MYLFFFLASIVYKYTEEKDVKTPRGQYFSYLDIFFYEVFFVFSYFFGFFFCDLSCFIIVGDFHWHASERSAQNRGCSCKELPPYLSSRHFLFPLCQRAECKRIKKKKKVNPFLCMWFLTQVSSSVTWLDLLYSLVWWKDAYDDP